jgi:hypothetical protein
MAALGFDYWDLFFICSFLFFILVRVSRPQVPVAPAVPAAAVVLAVEAPLFGQFPGPFEALFFLEVTA